MATKKPSGSTFGVSMPSSPFGMNPYAMGSMPRLAGPSTFTPAPPGFQWRPQPMRPQVGSRSLLDVGGSREFLMGANDPSRFGVPLLEEKDDVEDFAERMYGQEPRGNDGRMSRVGDALKNLLTGASGQAIAGTAGAVANVIGSSMDQKTQRERNRLAREQFEYQRQLDEEQRQRDAQIRALLMAQYDQFMPRR